GAPSRSDAAGTIGSSLVPAIVGLETQVGLRARRLTDRPGYPPPTGLNRPGLRSHEDGPSPDRRVPSASPRAVPATVPERASPASQPYCGARTRFGRGRQDVRTSEHVARST